MIFSCYSDTTEQCSYPITNLPYPPEVTIAAISVEDVEEKSYGSLSRKEAQKIHQFLALLRPNFTKRPVKTSQVTIHFLSKFKSNHKRNTSV